MAYSAITADPPKSHYTAAEALALLLAHRCNAKLYPNGTIAAQTIKGGKLATQYFLDHESLYRAAPIRSWLGV